MCKVAALARVTSFATVQTQPCWSLTTSRSFWCILKPTSSRATKCLELSSIEPYHGKKYLPPTYCLCQYIWYMSYDFWKRKIAAFHWLNWINSWITWLKFRFNQYCSIWNNTSKFYFIFSLLMRESFKNSWKMCIRKKLCMNFKNVSIKTVWAFNFVFQELFK